MLLSNIYISAMWSYRSIIVQLTFISALVWGQAAIAQHQVDHVWHDTTELCQVFGVADNVNSVVADTLNVQSIVLKQEVRECLSTELVPVAAQPAFARGPPR